jgi:hypothetical protein
MASDAWLLPEHAACCSALRELALRVYDRRAIVVEVVSRLHALQAATAGSRPQHELQVMCISPRDVVTWHVVPKYHHRNSRGRACQPTTGSNGC